MTLSLQGKVFLFSCHMLAPVLQMYDDWRGKGIGLSWSSQYERIIGWIIEELVYPEQLEQISHDESLKLQSEGEKTGDVVFERFYHQLQSIANDIEESYSVSSEELHFALYCLWATLVIEKFGEIMKSSELDGTNYQAHYREQDADFAELTRAINNSLDFQKQTISPANWEHLTQSAQELAEQWSAEARLISRL